MFPEHIRAQAVALLAEYGQAGLTVTTAESCTGGLIGGAITAIPDSSRIFERGFVTYGNDAKAELLNVPRELLAAHGAVNPDVALAMATGALARSKADVAVAVTGIAGPGGGSKAKPVGLVYIATAVRHGPTKVYEHIFSGDRDSVRLQTMECALDYLRAARPGAS